MKHMVKLSRLPARAADDTSDPGSDGYISVAEFLNIVLGLVGAAGNYLLTKYTADD